MIVKRLKRFGLILDKLIIAVLCDGAAVNIKFGRDIVIFQQLCLKHGLHLAVIEVFYKKPRQFESGTLMNEVFSLLHQ